MLKRTLKFTNAADIDDIIRAYDFKPMAGREDCYVLFMFLHQRDP